MELVKNLWRKLSHTKALDQSSGKLERDFFESVYRVTYVIGLSTSDRDIFYTLYSHTVKLMIVLVIFGETWYMFTETSGLDELAACINVNVIQYITILRYKNMMDHKDFYKKLATSMNSPYFDISTEKRRNLVDYWSQRNEKYCKILLGLGNCTLAAWIFLVAAQSLDLCPVDNNRLNPYYMGLVKRVYYRPLLTEFRRDAMYIYPLLDEVEYNLVVAVRLPFNYKTPLLYPGTYLFVLVVFMYTAHCVMVTDVTMQAHLMHLLCQFTVLGDCFENLLTDCRTGFEDVELHHLVYNKNFAAKYTKRLGDLVEQHKLILSHTMNLRNTLSKPMLGQLAASGILICFIGYQATTTIGESPAKCLVSFLYLGYNGFELYVICRWCEEITNQSHKIGEAVYCSGWECGLANLPGVRTTIMFIIARANKSLVLTAGGMYNLSLSSYTTLVKTSYSALTILLRFRRS